MLQKIKASEFKAKCLRLMDAVADSGEPIVITKNGKPVAQLEPFHHKPETLKGALRGHIAIDGDIIAPLDEAWAAQRGDAD